MSRQISSGNLFTKISSCIRDRKAPLFNLPDGTHITYGDMVNRTAQFANVLIELDVKPGDRVAVQIEKSIDALFLYLGCVRVGGVFLPLNTGYRDKELSYFIGDARPTVLVCSSDRKEALVQIASDHDVAHLETLDDGEGSLFQLANQAATTFATIERGDDDLAAILYTSGTTGRSKGAMLSHNNLASNAITLS